MLRGLLSALIVCVVATACGGGSAPFDRWTPGQAVEAFKAAGLEAENVRPMTKVDYGLAPMVAEEGVRFFIPSLCADCGGRLLRFDNQAGLEKTRDFYVKMGGESALLFSWTFVKDNVLVQINGDLPEEQARQYAKALSELR